MKSTSATTSIGDVAQAIAALDELLRLSTLDPDWDWRRCAIIAREWRRLDPVRAYAEHLGLKVDIASDTAPPIWRLTAHRAKGLEFDHVAILNGGWERPSRGEDAAAPRRLFYVAATRAKSSLTVLTDGAHPFLAPNTAAVLTRKVLPDSAILTRARLRYVSPKLEDMFLSFAGHLKEGDASLTAIAAAQVGQPVKLVQRGKTWAICTEDGTLLARFANNFAPPEGAVFLRGQITAILNWRSKDSGEDYRHLNKRDEWEIILPELVFEMP